MINQEKVQTIQVVNSHSGSDFWTHDAILHEDVIGRINEPLIITTIKGKRFVPATIVYIKDTNGDRSYGNERFRRDLIDYVRDISKLDELGLEKYKIYDPTSGIYMVALPLEESKIIKADESLTEIIISGGRLAEPILRLTKYFSNAHFGVIGSMQLGLDGEDSDIDLIVYGGKEYFEVVNQLMDSKVQKTLNVVFQNNDRIDKNALKYQKRYSISFNEAKNISRLRSRFSIKLESGTFIKMGINSCFKEEEYDGLTILETSKIKGMSIEGKIVNTTNSCSFPREYVVEDNGKEILVASHHWGHQLLEKLGEIVKIQGNLRITKEGKTILFIEDDKICFRKI